MAAMAAKSNSSIFSKYQHKTATIAATAAKAECNIKQTTKQTTDRLSITERKNNNLFKNH